MFTIPKKIFTRFCAHPYLSPFKLSRLAEIHTIVPNPGDHSTSSPPISRLSLAPPPRKRYGACRTPSSSPLNPKLPRPLGKSYRRVGISRTTSRPLGLRRSCLRNLVKAKAVRDSQFAGLSQAAFNTAKRARYLTREERIFLQEFAKLGVDREIITGLADARAAADRAVELAPLIDAEREAKAQASLAREKEQQRAFWAQREVDAIAEREQLEKAKRQADELFSQQQRLLELREQRQREATLQQEKALQREKALRRKQQDQFVEEAKKNEELRKQAERERLEETRRHREEVARLHEEQEVFRRIGEERIRLENERLAQRQRDIEAVIDAAFRFQQEVNDQIQREQEARFQAEQEAQAWFEAAQQARMATNHARAQETPRSFQVIDVSMKDVSMRTEMDVSMHTEMDTSMRIDIDASMRFAASCSPPPLPPPPPPPLTDMERFALYERKWTTLKSNASILSFEHLPWPTLHDVSSPADITYANMVEFFYHPDRPGCEGKSQKERSRVELLRWHPDKFLGKVLTKVDAAHRAMVEEAAGQVTLFLLAAVASSS